MSALADGVTTIIPRSRTAPRRVRRDAPPEIFVVHARLDADKKSVVFSERQRVYALETDLNCGEIVPITAQGSMQKSAFRQCAAGFHVLQIGNAGPERRFKVLGGADPLRSLTPPALKELLWRLGLDA